MLDDVIAVTNRMLCERPFIEQIERVCKMQPKAIILREKDLTEKEYTNLAEKVYNITSDYNVRLIIHTYISAARKLGIQTVHMSLQNLEKYMGNQETTFANSIPDSVNEVINKNNINRICSCEDVISSNGDIAEHSKIKDTNKETDIKDANIENINIARLNIDNIRIGCSIHSVEEAIMAEKLGASYITAGHIYATDCKKGLAPRGLDFLENVVRSVSIPVYAIGGIDIEGDRRKEVMIRGAAGSCIMSGMMRC